MSPQEILKYSKQRPFQPFRIHLADGTMYEIQHPELIMLCSGYLVIGIPVPGHRLLLCDRIERPELSDIVRLEPMPVMAQPS